MKSPRHRAVVRPVFASSLCFLGVLMVLACIAASQRQDVQSRREELSTVPGVLPAALQFQMKSLGARMRTAGKEETTLDGQFVDEAGNKKSIRVTYQISGMVRIEGIHEKTSVTFDGGMAHGIANRMDEVMLDVFASDTPEALLYSARSGASVILLGHNIQSDSSTASDSSGPRYDVYVVTAAGRVRTSNSPQSRRFYFDSATGLLASTRYTDSAGVSVETRFLKWETVDGSAYPTVIERNENGRLVFSIVANSVTGQPQRGVSTFR